jgi:hypothetical protein
LNGHAPDDTHSDAQGASNHARSHTVYDGNSGIKNFVPMRKTPGLPLIGIGSKVKRIQAAHHYVFS